MKNVKRRTISNLQDYCDRPPQCVVLLLRGHGLCIYPTQAPYTLSHSVETLCSFNTSTGKIELKIDIINHAPARNIQNPRDRQPWYFGGGYDLANHMLLIQDIILEES